VIRIQLISQATGVWVCLHAATYAAGVSVAQGRMSVLVVALVLKSPMTTRASNLVLAQRLQRLRNQLRTVVHPQHLRRAACRNEHGLEFGHEMFGGDRALDHVQQRLAVCSSMIDAIALPSTVESNWKSIAHNRFRASASIGAQCKQRCHNPYRVSLR
jgi:hypothetical protein